MPRKILKKLKEKTDSNKRKPILITGAVLLSIGIIWLIGFVIHSMLFVSTDDAFIDGHIIQIAPKVSGNIAKVFITDNQKVKKGDLLVEIDSRDFQAQLARAKAELQAAIAKQKGYKVNVNLTNITSTANVQQAAAGVDYSKYSEQVASQQIAVAQNNYNQAIAAIDESQAAAAQVEAEIETAKSQSKLAQTNLKRFRRLFEQGAVSRQDLDTAITNAQVANATVQAANKRESAAEARISSAIAARDAAADVIKQAEAQQFGAKAGIAQALGRLSGASTVPQQLAISRSQVENQGAEIRRLAAAVLQAELNLSYTKIYAPEDGYITKKSVERGAFVQIGQALFAIVPGNVWVTANFKETELTHMKPGLSANISVDAYPGLKLTGRVDSIQRGTGSRFSLIPPENAVGSYVKVVQRVPVKIIFDKPEDFKGVLAPGMSVVPEVKIR